MQLTYKIEPKEFHFIKYSELEKILKKMKILTHQTKFFLDQLSGKAIILI